MAINKIKLILELKKVLSNTVTITEQNFLNVRKVVFRAKRGLVALGPAGARALDNAINIILEDKEVANNFSKKYVENELQSIVIDAVADLTERKRPIGKLIGERVQELSKQLSEKMGEWFVAVPIDNLTLSVDNFRIGKVRFAAFEDAAYETWVDRLKDILERNPKLTEQQKTQTLEMYKKQVLSQFDNRAYAEVRMKAAEEVKAQERGIGEIAEVANALRMYGCVLFPRENRARIGLSGEIYKGIMPILRFSENKKLSSRLERVGALAPFKINDANVRKMQDLGLERVDRMYLNAIEERTCFEKRLSRAIYWFGQGVDSTNPTDRFIKYCIALESLLVRDPNEPVRNNVSARMAFVLGENLEDRRFVKKGMKKIYDDRSNLVHGRESEIAPHRLQLLEQFALGCLLRCLTQEPFSKFTRSDEFFDWFEERELT